MTTPPLPSSPPTGAAAGCACTLLRKATRAVARRYDAALAQVGLTVSQFAILRALERTGGVPLSRLAEDLVMERTSLYRALGPLLREDLVRLRETRDRRVKEAELTAAGIRRIAAGLPHWRRAQDSFLDDFGGSAWPDFAAALAHAVAVAAPTAPPATVASAAPAPDDPPGATGERP